MNLLFDLGHVLIDIEPKRTLQTFAALMEEKPSGDNGAKPLLTADGLLGGHTSQLIDLYQIGQITTDQFTDTALQACRQGVSKQQVLDAWLAMLLPFKQEKAKMLRQLHERHIPFYILSNINDSHVLWTRDHCPELQLASGIFFSNEIHIAKPAPEAYQYVIDHTGILPAETLYIDDLVPNLEAGRQFGFQCLHATDDNAWMPVVRKIIEESK